MDHAEGLVEAIAGVAAFRKVEVFTFFSGMDPCMYLQTCCPKALTDLGVCWRGTALSADDLRKHGSDRIRYLTSNGAHAYLEPAAADPGRAVDLPRALVGQLTCRNQSGQKESFESLGSCITALGKLDAICMDVVITDHCGLDKFRQLLADELEKHDYSLELVQQHSPRSVGLPANCSRVFFLAAHKAAGRAVQAPGPLFPNRQSCCESWGSVFCEASWALLQQSKSSSIKQGRGLKLKGFIRKGHKGL